MHLFSEAPLNVQKLPCEVILYKIVLRNFKKLTAKHLWRTRLPALLFPRSWKLQACNMIKKNSDNDMFWWSSQHFLEQLFYRAPVQAAIGGVLYKKLFLKILQYSQVNTYYLFIYYLFISIYLTLLFCYFAIT